MKHTLTLLVLASLVLSFSSCKEKKEQNDIIITEQKEAKPQGPVKMKPITQDRNIEWVGNQYRLIVERTPDESLPMVEDESGQKYYDNIIRVRVVRSDGTNAVERQFHKSDFLPYTQNAAVAKKGALLGVVLDRIEGNALFFAASVGSPDENSDEYVPLLLKITSTGGMSISLDTRLDTDNQQAAESQDDI